MKVRCVKDCGHGLCRKRKAFAKHGGRLNVEKMLKLWVLEGYRFKGVGGQKKHLQMEFPPVLPSFGALDMMPFARFEEEVNPSKRAKKK